MCISSYPDPQSNPHSEKKKKLKMSLHYPFSLIGFLKILRTPLAERENGGLIEN